tara:strand:+ start:831 stop:1385 length:555 start_codon:yes stop_codon:yes gene_type:complete
MDDTKLRKDQLIPENDNTCNYLLNKSLPKISLPNQEGNLLKLYRSDTFRLVIYFYPLTGSPKKKLPNNWENIPGTSGCTLENCIFRDNYENLIQLNALPIGISTQSIEDIKEMTLRLGIQFDILSDFKQELTKVFSLPTFEVEKKVYLKSLTIIVEKNIVKKVFYPINSVNKHIQEIIKWLKKY